jgi:DNA-binding MarR family transcriptional regulator
MNKNKSVTDLIHARVNKLADLLLRLRKVQNQAEAAFIATLGNLNLQELNVLNCIGDHGSSIMSEIAKQLSLSLSSITVIVDKLVKLNLVSRIRSEDDRRIVYGSLTPEGEKIYQLQIDHLHEVLKNVLAPLTNQEQENLIQIIQKLTQAFV